jgi:hypothetical protein
MPPFLTLLVSALVALLAAIAARAGFWLNTAIYLSVAFLLLDAARLQFEIRRVKAPKKDV